MPSTKEGREAALMERMEEFGHMGENGIIEIENMDAYLNFLRDVGAKECIAKKTAPDKLERVEPGTTFTTYVVDDSDGKTARVEQENVTATEERCWKRTAYDTEGNVITADLNGTPVPNEWLQTEAQVRKASMIPDGISLDELDGQLLVPNSSERHLIETPFPIHFETSWGDQTIYAGGAMLVTDLKTNETGQFEGNGNAAYGIGKVEFERRHELVKTLNEPEMQTASPNMDPKTLQALQDMADASFAEKPETSEKDHQPSTEGIREKDAAQRQDDKGIKF